jgi:peptide/nickel transport system substrate-binding protein
VEVPSITGGAWQVSADATMEVTWKVRTNARWHDGTPLTSGDLVFAFTVYKDRDMAHPYVSQMRLMDSAVAPDPQTLVVRWRAIYVQADEAPGLVPLPRHLLEGLYQSDKEAFVASTRFTDEFIGLGPYRMVRWERGSHAELSRFDDYFLGRPPLDAMVVRYVGDPNIMAANILAEAIHVVLPPSLDLDTALEVKRQWEGTGNQVRVGLLPSFLDLDIQYRPELARPANGLTNPVVRRALYHAIDRQSLAEVMAHGTAPIADSWFRPGTSFRREGESSIPQYPYDPTGARRLLGQAGWLPGSDGILISSQTSEPFAVELWANTRAITKGDKQIALIAEDWKTVGLKVDLYPIPIARASDREHEASFPAALLSRATTTALYTRLDSTLVAGPSNSWSGRNIGGYRNRRVDSILRALEATIEPRERLAQERALVEEIMGEVAWMPLYWEVRPVLMLASVQADISANNPGWNAFTWDKK